MWINEEEVDKLIRSKPNVLSWRYDLTKIKQGRDTGIPCITVFVKKKVKASRLRRDELIPEEINGILKCPNPNCKDLLIKHGIRVVLNDIIDWCLRKGGLRRSHEGLLHH